MDGGAFWLVSWLLGTPAGALIWILTLTVWGPWLLARTWLTLHGHLPWAVMAFLQDAHRRGVLRQAGGVYQFRHARLQNRLATAYRRMGTDAASAQGGRTRYLAGEEQ